MTKLRTDNDTLYLRISVPQKPEGSVVHEPQQGKSVYNWLDCDADHRLVHTV